MKFAGILNETGPTLNENAFHSFVVAKQIFLWQLPQLHHAIGSYQSSLPPSFRHLESTRNESSRMPSSRAAPPIGHEGFVSSLTPHTPCSQPCQDKQRPSKEPLSPITINDTSSTSSSMVNTPSTPSPHPTCHFYHYSSSFHSRPSMPFSSKQFSSSPFRQLETFGGQCVPMVDRGRHQSSLTHNSNLTPFPATPTSSPSIHRGPSLAGTSNSSPTYGNRMTSTKLDVLSHSKTDTTARLCDSEGRRSSEYEDRVAQVIKTVTGEGVTEEMLADTSLRYLEEHRPCQHCRDPHQHHCDSCPQQHGSHSEHSMTYQPSFVTRDKQVQTDVLSFSFDSEPFEKKLNDSKSKCTINPPLLLLEAETKERERRMMITAQSQILHHRRCTISL